MTDKIQRESIRSRRVQAQGLVETAARLRESQSQNLYDLGGLYNHVLNARLWDSWPRSVTDTAGKRVESKRATFGYATFDDWCWNEMGARGSTARYYAADYRRYRKLNLPKADKDLFRCMIRMGVGKARLVMRGALYFESQGESEERILKRARRYANTVLTTRMTEKQLAAMLEVEGADVGLPEVRPPALKMASVPREAPSDWLAVAEALRAASHHAASLDKWGTIDKLREALRAAEEVSG